MKEIKTIIKQKVVKVPAVFEEKEVEKIIYEAEDGSQFEDKDQCKSHSETLKRKAFIDSLDVIDFSVYEVFPENFKVAFIKSEDELNTFISYQFGNYLDITKIYNEATYPQYFGFSYNDGGDYRSSLYIYNEQDIKQIFNGLDEIRGKLKL